MRERGTVERIDHYFRRNDSVAAAFFRTVSSSEGSKYRKSPTKRIMDLSLAVPGSIAAVVPVVVFGGIAKVEDGGRPFYVQPRVGESGKELTLYKIRTMHEKVDDGREISLKNNRDYKPEDDPRNTRTGRFLRKYDLEELPQLFQIILGQLSLIGIRAATYYVFDYMQEIRPKTSHGWFKRYSEGKPGLISLNAAMNPKRKDDKKRYHYDVFYGRKASLGLDVYILFRMALKVLRLQNK